MLGSDKQTKRNIIFGCGIIILLLILAFSFQGTRGLWQPDEGYYVGTAVTMLDKHSLLIPYLGEEEIFLDKPPLLYWGIMSSMQLLGHSEFAARFFIAFCYVCTCLIVGMLSFALFNSTRLAVLSSIIYATMFVPFIAANFVTPDTPLALLTAVSALAFWKSTVTEKTRSSMWKIVFFTVVGIGFLAKGPAVLIPCASMLMFLVLRGEVNKFFYDRWIALGAALFVLIGLGWYIWIACHLPGSIAYFWDNQIWGRLISHKYKRNPGFGGGAIYLFVLTLGSMPWSLLCVLPPVRITLAELRKKLHWRCFVDTRQKLFLVLWVAVSLSILCLASSKLGLYALPLFVPLALMCAKLWSDRIDFFTLRSGSKRVLSGSILFVLIWCVVLLAVKYVLGVYPSDNDTRALWKELSLHIPKPPYAIITVDQRADGLAFYGATIEHTTSKADPYPTYRPTERFTDEILGNIQQESKESMLFIVSNDEVVQTIGKVLSTAGLRYTTTKLSFSRWLVASEGKH